MQKLSLIRAEFDTKTASHLTERQKNDFCARYQTVRADMPNRHPSRLPETTTRHASAPEGEHTSAVRSVAQDDEWTRWIDWVALVGEDAEASGMTAQRSDEKRTVPTR